MSNRVLLSGLVASLVVLSGCGGSDVVSVSGTIKLDGVALEGVSVNFNPIAAGGETEARPASYGITDSNGHYELKFISDDSPGASIGKHRVVLSAQTETGDASATPEKIPAHERNKEYEVPKDGTTSADFVLTSKPQ